LGDLPIQIFVAKQSSAFDSWKETEALSFISTSSTLTILEDAPHGFIFDPKYTTDLVDAIRALMASM